MTRAEKVAEIRRLKSLGLRNHEIGTRLGLTQSAVSNLMSDPDGAKQKQRRERYRLDCERCGARTDGSGGYAEPRRFCLHCHGDAVRRIWTREIVIEAIQRWSSEYGQPPLSTDWNVADRPPWAPPAGCVYRSKSHPTAPFTSWAEAIEAAGFPRPERGRYERSPETLARLSASVRAAKARPKAAA